MIPVELYGINAQRCERMYGELPALVDDMEDDDDEYDDDDFIPAT